MNWYQSRVADSEIPDSFTTPEILVKILEIAADLSSGHHSSDAAVGEMKEQLESVKVKSREIIQKIKQQGETTRSELQEQLDKALGQNDELRKQLQDLKQQLCKSPTDGTTNEPALKESAEVARAEAERLKEQLDTLKAKSRELVQKVKLQGEEARAEVQASLDEALERNRALEEQLVSARGDSEASDEAQLAGRQPAASEVGGVDRLPRWLNSGCSLPVRVTRRRRVAICSDGRAPIWPLMWARTDRVSPPRPPDVCSQACALLCQSVLACFEPSPLYPPPPPPPPLPPSLPAPCSASRGCCICGVPAARRGTTEWLATGRTVLMSPDGRAAGPEGGRSMQV